MMPKINPMMVGERQEFGLRFFCLKDFSSRSYNDSTSTNQPKIRIQFKHDNGKLFVMVRYAKNLVRHISFLPINRYEYPFLSSH